MERVVGYVVTVVEHVLQHVVGRIVEVSVGHVMGRVPECVVEPEVQRVV